ncbi:MAG: hypothetical protein M0003_16950 [Acidithiobacillus sp.]|nr:hypothetical protein [Acidithiobacillus sp.]
MDMICQRNAGAAHQGTPKVSALLGFEPYAQQTEAAVAGGVAGTEVEESAPFGTFSDSVP